VHQTILVQTLWLQAFMLNQSDGHRSTVWFQKILLKQFGAVTPPHHHTAPIHPHPPSPRETKHEV